MGRKLLTFMTDGSEDSGGGPSVLEEAPFFTVKETLRKKWND